MNKVLAQLKAIVAAIIAVLGGVAFTTITDPDAAINPDAPAGAAAAIQLPNTTTEWITVLVLAFASYLGVYGTGNRESSAVLRRKLDDAVAREADTRPPTTPTPPAAQ